MTGCSWLDSPIAELVFPMPSRHPPAVTDRHVKATVVAGEADFTNFRLLRRLAQVRKYALPTQQEERPQGPVLSNCSLTPDHQPINGPVANVHPRFGCSLLAGRESGEIVPIPADPLGQIDPGLP